MKKILLLIAVFVASPCALLARGEASDTTKVEEEVVVADASLPKVEDLQKQVESLKTTVADLQEQIKGYKARLEVGDINDQKNDNKLKEKDKTIQEKEQTIKSKEQKIQSLNKMILSSDTLVVTLLNTCLYYPYSEKAVSRAISNCDKVHSSELSNEVGQLKNLLSKYGAYTEELRAIFVAAENDKEMQKKKIKFVFDKVVLSYLTQIESTNYCREVSKASWTIPYLNDVIAKAKNILKTYDPVKGPLRLQYLLDN